MRALFFGLGSIGQRHMRNLRTLMPDVELYAVRKNGFSPVLSDTNEVILGVDIKSWYGITELTSIEDGLAVNPNIIFICNPSSLHLDYSVMAIKTNAFIFIEKPLAHSLVGLDVLRSAKNRIAVGFQYRFHPVIKKLKELISEKIIGDIASVSMVNGEYMPGWHPYEDYKQSYASKKSLGGGVLLTQIHDFDNLLYLFGRPQTLYAVGGHLSSLEIDVEDCVQILMEINSGERKFPASISLDFLQTPPNRSIKVVGDLGRIECDLNKSKLTVFLRDEQTPIEYCFEDFKRNDMFLEEMENFLQLCAGECAELVDLEGGMDSLKIAVSALDSIERGVSINIDWDDRVGA
jgi:predicted dehydrogenase